MLHLQVFQLKTNDKFCKASGLAWIDTLYSSPKSFVDFWDLWKRTPSGCASTNHLGLLYMLSMWQVNLAYLAEV